MLGDVVLRQDRGGITVVEAPDEVRIALDVVQGSCAHALYVEGDLIRIADQVIYRVVGWQGEPPAFVAVLVEDLRGA